MSPKPIYDWEQFAREGFRSLPFKHNLPVPVSKYVHDLTKLRNTPEVLYINKGFVTRTGLCNFISAHCIVSANNASLKNVITSEMKNCWKPALRFCIYSFFTFLAYPSEETRHGPSPLSLIITTTLWGKLDSVASDRQRVTLWLLLPTSY